MDQDKAKKMLQDYLAGASEEKDREIIERWYQKLIDSSKWSWLEVDKQEVGERILSGLNAQLGLNTGLVKVSRVNIWRNLSIAASIIVILSIGLFLFTNRYNQTNKSKEQIVAQDMLPAHQDVILTLSDGTKRIVDNISNGNIGTPDSFQAVKSEGALSYADNNSEKILYNTISTEKGRVFHLELPDGTNVWMDALSSIHFPTSFPGAERVVEVTGQVYFEVTKKPDQPFKVKSGNQTVEVLGTHFNINSYDKKGIYTTLLEGSVKVSSAKGEKLKLSPGQQSKVDGYSSLNLVNGINVDDVMSWRRGLFSFSGHGVAQIMEEISRWYEIEVVYEGIPEPGEIIGGLDRKLTLKQVVQVLKRVNINCRIQGNKLIVEG